MTATILIIAVGVYAWLLYEIHTAPLMDEDYESDDDAIF